MIFCHNGTDDEKSWLFARASDRLQLVNGDYVIVEQIQHELAESPVKVYNFRVKDNHTYYVGSNSVLVHNANCGNYIFKQGFDIDLRGKASFNDASACQKSRHMATFLV